MTETPEHSTPKPEILGANARDVCSTSRLGGTYVSHAPTCVCVTEAPHGQDESLNSREAGKAVADRRPLVADRSVMEGQFRGCSIQTTAFVRQDQRAWRRRPTRCCPSIA